MDCLNAGELFSLYIDGKLDSNLNAELEKHTSRCDKCKKELAELKELMLNLNELEQIELPENYHIELMSKINVSGKIIEPNRMKKVLSIRRYGAAAAGVLLTLIAFSVLSVLITSVNSNRMNFKTAKSDDVLSYSTAANSGAVFEAAGAAEQSALFSIIEEPEIIAMQDESVSYDLKQEDVRIFYGEAESGTSDSGTAVSETASLLPDTAITAKLFSADLLQTEKIEKTVTIEIKVEDITEAVRVINSLNGYNTTSEVSYHNPELDKQFGSAYITRRVGANELEYVRDILRSLGEVIQEGEQQYSHTNQYDELLVMASNAENEIFRLNTLIEKSSTLDNIIFIENRIAEINRQLDSYMGSIRWIEGVTNEPYIKIVVTAQKPYEFITTKVGFSDRMEQAFSRSLSFTKNVLEGFTIFVVSSVIPLIAVTLVVLAVVFIIKKAVKMNK